MFHEVVFESLFTKDFTTIYDGYEDFETCQSTFVDKTHFVSVKLTYLKNFGFNFKVQIFLEGHKNLKKISHFVLTLLKVSKSQKQFFLKLHCPKNEQKY